MSFTKDTYTKAKAAIERGDSDTLVRLIRRPVLDTSPKKTMEWLSSLVRTAAQRGQGKALRHLVLMAPPSQALNLRGAAWAQAEEHGHPELAQRVKPRAGGDLTEWYVAAVAAEAWGTVTRFIRDGYQPPSTLALQTMEALETHGQAAEHAFLFQSLLPLVPKHGLATAALVALQLKDEAALNHCLGHGLRAELQKKLTPLRRATMVANRYDWFVKVSQAAGESLADTWMVSFVRDSVSLGGYDFFEDAVRDRPGLLRQLREDSGSQTLILQALLLVATRQDNLGVADTRLKRLFYQVCEPAQVGHFREKFEGYAPTTMGTRDAEACVNVLALWAPEEVQAQWFDAEPERLAPAIAVVRDQRVRATHLGDTGLKRTRMRP